MEHYLHENDPWSIKASAKKTRNKNRKSEFFFKKKEWEDGKQENPNNT